MFNTELYAQTRALTDLVNWKAVLLAAALLVFTRAVRQTKKLHPIFFILASAVVGVVLSF